jgi:hypothetical protein
MQLMMKAALRGEGNKENLRIGLRGYMTVVSAAA